MTRLARLSLNVLLASLGPRLAAAQRGAPALPACTTPQSDTSHWKEFTAEIAPITFRAPPDFEEHRFTHRYTFSNAPPSARPRRHIDSQSQTWYGRSAPHLLALRRSKYDSIVHAIRPGSPQQHELTYCHDTIDGFAAVIRSDRMVAQGIIGTDTLDAYEAEAAIALAPNDTLFIGGTGDDPATQAVVLAIIHSVRIVGAYPLHR